MRLCKTGWEWVGVAKAVVQGSSIKKMLREISQARCFPVNFAKFLRTPFLKEHLLWLLLEFVEVYGSGWELVGARFSAACL